MSFNAKDDRTELCNDCGGMVAPQDFKLGIDTSGDLILICPLCDVGVKIDG